MNTWSPSPAQLAQMQANLTGAYVARHQLMIGGLPVEIHVEGRTVRFNRANLEQLDAYISGLELALSNRPHRNGAIGVVF